MIQFDTIEEALEDLKKGKIILVTDDPDRENEGDFICAAEFATTANINFMASYGKGLICMPMSAEYVRKLRIPQMVQQNTDNHETAFTVSIDHVSTSTGMDWWVKEKTEDGEWGDETIYHPSGNPASGTCKVPLKPNTRWVRLRGYCNYGVYFRNIKITKRKARI